MGGGDGGSGAIAAQNAENQRRIQQGMTELNSIFYGGTYGTGPASSYNPSQQYYDVQGNPISSSYDSNNTANAFNDWFGKHRQSYEPTNQSSNARGNPVSLDQQASYENMLRSRAYGDYMRDEASAGDLFTGKTTTKGFGPEFYQKAQQDYLDFAQPQLESQYKQTQNQLQAKLANQGLLGGSAQEDLTSALGRDYSTQQINLANTALGQSNALRQNVNQQYNTLVGQLEASANPSATAQQALQSASTFSAPSAMPAVGQLFNTYANTYLAGQNAQMYNNAASNPYLNYNVGVNPMNAPVVNSGM